MDLIVLAILLFGALTIDGGRLHDAARQAQE